MSLMDSLVKILKTEIPLPTAKRRSELEKMGLAGNDEPVRDSAFGEEGATTLIASRPNMRELTSDAYIEEFSARTRKVKPFDFRYAAYGDTAQLNVCSVTAHRHDHLTVSGPNALSLSVDYHDDSIASLLMVFDGENGLAADMLFKKEIEEMRERREHLCELSAFYISKDLQSRRAVGGLIHIVYLYARNARKTSTIVLTTKGKYVEFFEKFLGMKPIAARAGVTLMRLELDLVKKMIRLYGGMQDDAKDPPYGLYPYFAAPKDEPGLLYRVLEHFKSV